MKTLKLEDTIGWGIEVNEYGNLLSLRTPAGENLLKDQRRQLQEGYAIGYQDSADKERLVYAVGNGNKYVRGLRVAAPLSSNVPGPVKPGKLVTVKAQMESRDQLLALTRVITWKAGTGAVTATLSLKLSRRFTLRFVKLSAALNLVSGGDYRRLLQAGKPRLSQEVVKELIRRGCTLGTSNPKFPRIYSCPYDCICPTAVGEECVTDCPEPRCIPPWITARPLDYESQEVDDKLSRYFHDAASHITFGWTVKKLLEHIPLAEMKALGVVINYLGKPGK